MPSTIGDGISNGRSREDQSIIIGYVGGQRRDCTRSRKNRLRKKMHTFKNQFIVLPNGEDIVDVIVGKLEN